jgi:hypothetical protein
MIIFEYSSHFLKSRKKFLKNQPKLAEATIKAITLFYQDPTHPSLHLEKLRNNSVWTIRIDIGNRLFFIWKTSNTALFIDVGPHDKYRRY